MAESSSGRYTANTAAIIERWKEHRCLWDALDPGYKNPLLRQQAIGSLASRFGLTEEACRKKLDNLRTYYRKELSKEASKRSSSYGTEECYKSTWPHMEAMSFLRDQVKPVPMDNTLDALPPMWQEVPCVSIRPSSSGVATPDDISLGAGDADDEAYEHSAVPAPTPFPVRRKRRAEEMTDTVGPYARDTSSLTAMLEMLDWNSIALAVQPKDRWWHFGQYIAECLRKIEATSSSHAHLAAQDLQAVLVRHETGGHE